jgi:hypothetical protein
MSDTKLSKDARNTNAVLRTLIKSAIAAGYALSVDDGEEITVTHSRDAKALFAALQTTDEDRLHLGRPNGRGGFTREGSITLVYGNSASEVIADYSTSLDPLMNIVCEYASKYE